MYRIAGGALILVVSVGALAGGVALWRGGPGVWPDVVAEGVVIRRTATGLLIIAALFLVSALGVLLSAAWALPLTTFVTVVALTVSFWGNRVLFGDIRPLHTGTNTVLAILILWLVWKGYR